jgi:WSC domain-containing protein
MKKFTLCVFSLASVLNALSALAQIQAHVPPERIVTQPLRFPPRDNGAFACFADETATPPLSGFSTLPGLAGRDIAGQVSSSIRMTNSSCRAYCASNNFIFAGTQSGAFCFCGNSAGSHGTSTACTTGCLGYGGEVCGGPSANSVSWAQDFVGPYWSPPAPPMNGGQCVINIGAPGYRDSQLHRWTVSGAPVMAPTGKQYPLTWTVTGGGSLESLTTGPGTSTTLIRSWTWSGTQAVTYQARLSNGTLSFKESTTAATFAGGLVEAPQRQYIDGVPQTPAKISPGDSAEYPFSANTFAQALAPIVFSTSTLVNASMGGIAVPHGAPGGWSGTIQCTWNLIQ